ncbi:hypothetical protein ACFQL7_18975 [Halocatena marina]|uniref:DUF1102 domain-containing protein n=2 Tax=Halocatena marina TaxID=2934937 RepID=A0ABD5YU08_9EURY
MAVLADGCHHDSLHVYATKEPLPDRICCLIGELTEFQAYPCAHVTAPPNLMNRLRRLAIVLMAVGLITSAIYATGAFTNITAQRDANVRVAGDGASYLSLQPANSSNGEYAVQRNGQLHVSLGGTLGGESSGTGVNQESLTVVKDIFTITNKGAQPFGVWMTDSSEAVTFESGNNRRSLEGKQQAVPLKPGESVTVGLTVDTRQHEGDSVIKSVQIHADSEISGSAVGEVGSVDQRKPTPSSQTGQKSGTGTTTSDSSNNDGENPTKKATGSTTAKQKEEHNRKSDEDIEKVISFLKKHPELTGMITKVIPGGITSWVRENPEQAKSFMLGGAFGEMGMPGGMHEVNQADSPFYLLGMLGIAATPYVGIVADARDFTQNSVSAVTKQSMGDAGEALLDLTGLAASAGLGFGVGDAPKMGAYITNWLSKFPSEANVATKVISKFIPSSTSKKMTVGALNKLSDGAASKLINKGVPMDDVIRYAKDGNLKKVAEASDTVVPATIKRGEMTNKQWADLVNKGHDPRRMKRLLDSHRYEADDIQMLTRNDVDTKTAESLAKDGYGPDDVRMFTRKDVDPKKVEDLAEDDIISSNNLRDLIKKDVP